MSLLGEQYSKLYNFLLQNREKELSKDEIIKLISSLTFFMEIGDFKALSEVVEFFLLPPSSPIVMLSIARTLFRVKNHLPGYERNIELCVKSLSRQGVNGEILFKGLW